MAAPNIGGATVSLYKKSAGVALTTTLTATLLANSAASGKLYEVTCVSLCNYTSAAVTVTVDLQKSGGSTYKKLGAVVVPANTTIIIDVKGWNLEEGDTLRGGASANSSVDATVDYNDYGN